MKTNYLKKCMSVLLSIAMLASLFAVSFTASAEEALVVDGKSYQMGDVVELKGELQVNNWLMNGQVEVPYDSTKLKLVAGQTEETMFPALAEQGIKVYYNNLEKDNKFLFNFSQPLAGADFTTSKTLYNLKFEVIGTGETALADSVKIVDMKSYSFEGSPEGKDDFTMVAVNDEKGGVIADKGSIKNEAISSGEVPPVETLTVDGKAYKVGDTFTFVGDLKTNRWLMNTQFELNYDQTKLNIVEVSYPVLKEAGIEVYDNYSNEEGWFTFNFSDPNKGANFTEQGELYVITFKAVSSGETTLSDKTNIVEMSAFPFDGNPADHKDETLVPVDITDNKGGLNSDNGTIENAIKEETPVEKTLTVDGKTYNVGDTFKLVGELQANRWVMNAQFTLNFDSSKIKIVDKSYPAVTEAGIEVVDNYDNDAGWYTFNFTDVEKGVDFTKTANLYEVTFEVIGGGETELAKNANMEVLSTFQYEGSPADNPGVQIEIVDIADGKGGVKDGEGTIEHVIDPQEQPPVTETLNVDGTEYKVGETVKFNVDLETMRWIMNAQFSLKFDPTKLQLKSAKYPAVQDAGIDVVDNISNETGFFTFNFTDVKKGVDFTTKNNMAALEFEVVGTGETSLKNNAKFDVLSAFNFDGSPADNPGVQIEIVDITDGKGGVAEGNTVTYYYGNPTVVEGFTVNGQEVQEGDIVEYRVWVKNDENWLVNGEFDILYTNHYLEFLDVTYPGLTTIAGYVVDNQIKDSGLTESQGKTAGELLFNFSNIHSGVDFTQGAYMAVFRFKVHESTDPSIPAQGASVIELNGNVVNDMYAFKFAGTGSTHSILEKQELDRLIGENGLPTTDEFRLETEIIREPKLDTSALQEAYDKWSKLDKTGYTAESVAELEKVLEETKKIIDDIAAGNTDAYTQEMINKAVTDLNAAGEALVVDKSALVALIEKANGYINDKENIYIPSTIEALQTAVNAAQAVVDNEKATVQDVADQIKALQEAINNIRYGALLGDADFNWKVDVNDATATQYEIANVQPEKFVFVKELADVNKDGNITIEDVTLIQMITAKLMEAEIVEIPDVL